MTNLYRVRTALTGFPGGPGVSTMYFLDAATAIPSVRAFWATVASAMPISVVIQVESTGDVIESTTGALVGSYTRDPVLAVFGTATGRYAAPTGCVVSWLTGTVADGRRLRGRTFLVPLTGEAFDINGTLVPATQNQVKGAADALLFEQSASMVVWGRPRAAIPADGSRRAVTARAGTSGLVTETRVPDKAAVLRSRRD